MAHFRTISMNTQRSTIHNTTEARGMLAIILSVLIMSVRLKEAVLLLYQQQLRNNVPLNIRKSDSVKSLKIHLFKTIFAGQQHLDHFRITLLYLFIFIFYGSFNIIVIQLFASLMNLGF